MRKGGGEEGRRGRGGGEEGEGGRWGGGEVGRWGGRIKFGVEGRVGSTLPHSTPPTKNAFRMSCRRDTDCIGQIFLVAVRLTLRQLRSFVLVYRVNKHK